MGGWGRGSVMFWVIFFRREGGSEGGFDVLRMGSFGLDCYAWGGVVGVRMWLMN